MKYKCRSIFSSWKPSLEETIRGNKHLNRRFDSLWGDHVLEDFFSNATEEISFDYMFSEEKEWINLTIFVNNPNKDYQKLFDRFNESPYVYGKSLDDYKLEPISLPDLKIFVSNWKLIEMREVFELEDIQGTICSLTDMKIQISLYFGNLKYK